MIYIVDIDECAKHYVCDQQCQNTPGSFLCTCRDGFVINSNNYCDGKIRSSDLL